MTSVVVKVREDRSADKRGKSPEQGSHARLAVCAARQEVQPSRENRFPFKRRKRVAVVASREERGGERSKRAGGE